ncbi:MAG: bifunctional DNA-binding transcriptional regulator/O6-methylguanine-DNA methyltransferase Ada [Janthinobacterium lividum]
MPDASMPDAQMSDADRLQAVRRRDPAADGAFLYSVVTTGVYCRPSCAARPALACNIAFHETAAAAERAGFRPCRRCRPDLPPRPERDAALVAAACRMIEAAETPPALEQLARAAACSPSHFHRLFRRATGVTPLAYAAAHRQARLQAGLAAGAPVTRAIYEAGYNSAGRFYADADAALGMTAGHYRRGGAGEDIRHTVRPCSLGQVLVAASTRGVCAILLGDDPARLQADLAARFPRAALVPDDAELAAWVDQVVAAVDEPHAPPGGPAPALLPLDIRGTAFQRRVWSALRAIPSGQTRSYTQLAAAVAAPRAVRAVAAACAANPLAVLVPCHRVVGAKGALTGYRWGLARKQALLDRESRSLDPRDRPADLERCCSGPIIPRSEP